MLFGNIHHAHVNFAFEAEQCGRCGQSNAVLPCAGFGDDFFLAHFFRK